MVAQIEAFTKPLLDKLAKQLNTATDRIKEIETPKEYVPTEAERKEMLDGYAKLNTLLKNFTETNITGKKKTKKPNTQCGSGDAIRNTMGWERPADGEGVEPVEPGGRGRQDGSPDSPD